MATSAICGHSDHVVPANQVSFGDFSGGLLSLSGRSRPGHHAARGSDRSMRQPASGGPTGCPWSICPGISW